MSVTDIYPSRNGGEETIIPRTDPVVYSDVRADDGQALNASQIEFYSENGYLILPDYMPEAVAPLCDEINLLKKTMAGRNELITEPDSDGIRTIFKPHACSKLVDRFSRHPKILRVAKQLLGSDVYITQSRVNVKPAFKGRAFAWHSDFETWHVEDGMPRMRAVTAWIMLTENNEHNGPLYVIPGSHKVYVSCADTTGKNNYTRSLKKQQAGVPRSDTMLKLLENRTIQSIRGNAGTVVFHECNIMHGSPDNISATPRTVLKLVYNSCDNALVQPFSYQSPRPEYLRNPDITPLEAINSQEFVDE